ncbi:MAG: FHA domain-containing protein [Planctomycetes bacterium]|nr:FHA domain-containing protein [Planctomycetota bacterium]
MEWKGYQPCCRVRALDGAARICPDCGQVLLRCRSFAGCRALLGPLEACPIHVAPRLQLQRGAVLAANLGDRITLPLVLANASGAGGELRLRRLLRMLPGQEPEELTPLWETVRPGEERSFTVETGVLEAGGTSRVSLVLVLATSLGGVDEDYAFATEILLRVRRDETKQIVQNIRVEGGSFAAGASAVVQTGPSVHESWKPADGGPGDAPAPLALERAEAFELRHGIRGYRDEGCRVPSTVELECRGFRADDAPPAGRPFAGGARFAAGRNGRKARADNPTPNDLALRIYRGTGSAVDAERTGRISGRHFELFLQNDRLVLRALGRHGTWHGDAALPAGTEVVLQPGDRIAVLEPATAVPQIAVAMHARGPTVERIVLERRG